MKRTLLFLMAVFFAAISNVQTTFAQASYNHSYTRGVEVAEGDEYFLYNIGEAQFLTGGMDWGSHASTDYAGKALTISRQVNGYKIYSYYYSENGLANSGYLTTNAYTDTGNNDCDWVFTPVTVNGYTNAYTITNGSDYLYADPADTRVQIGANPGNNYAYWILIPKSARDAVGDYTYYIQNAGMNRFWERACWSGSTWGNTGFGTGGRAANPCSEKYHGVFDFYQALSTPLPNGTYKIYAQGFWRQDGSSAGPVLYANDDNVELAVFNANGEGTPADMTGASDAFSAGKYVNVVTTTVTDGNLRLGINITDNSQWVIWDNFVIQRVGEVLSDVAVALPANGDMAADTWYYVDVNSADLYEFITTTFADIVYVTDGSLDVFTAASQATNFANEAGTHLDAIRYYIKSYSANNFALSNIAPATAADMQRLQAAIVAAEEHTLGFEDGEYAPYNNVAAITTLNEAKAIDQNNPSLYIQTTIAEMITALQNSTWTANSGEVNAVYWKTDYSASDIAADGYIHPIGWTNTGYNTRVYSSTAGNLGTNTGISAVDGTALFSKYNTTYGEILGYTMPLKANTYYKISFKYCGWGNTPTTNVVMSLNGNAVTVTPASFRPETNNGNTEASNWYDYSSVFQTGDAGDYMLALNKVDNGQQQIAWGNMIIVKSTAENLPYTLVTGKMNAEVEAAQAAAEAAYTSNPTFESYEALLEAIDAANASVAEYQRIAARLALLAAQTGDIPQAALENSTTYTNYDNGVYVSLDEVIPAFRTDVAAYWAENVTANADLTAFIVNQGFQFNDNTEWNGAGGIGGDGSNITMEWYNANYDFYQTLSGLPSGTYLLKVQAFYRPGTNENTSDAQNAILYAGTSETPLKLVASEGKTAADGNNGFTTSNTNSGSTVYVPNSMSDAAKAFTSGAYENELQFVVSNGTVKIGVKKSTRIDRDWSIFDNFRLIYVSPDAAIAPELVDAPMNAGIRQAQQDAYDAWNANKTIDNYNTLIAAIDAAQQSADKYVIIDQRIPKLQAQADDIDATVLRTKYDNGEYVEADDVFDAYREVIAAYYAANPPAADADMSRFLINPDFEYGNVDGWAPNISDDTGARDAHNATYTFSNSHGDWVFDSWNPRNEMIWVVQETVGLPQGTYEVTAVFATDKDRTIEFTAEDVQPRGSEQMVSFQPVDEDITFDKSSGIEKTITVFVSDGKLRVGAHSWGFFKADNFRLKFISTDINDPDLSKPMNRFERQNYIDARAAYDADPSQENLYELLERKLIVENSIKAYEAAKNTFDHVLEMMSKTNVYTYDAYFTIDDMYRKYGPEEGYYHYETLEDDVAFDMWRMFFGNGWYRDPNNFQIPAVPFIASAWDCGHDGYAYAYTGPGEEGTDHGSDYYANTWSMEGKDDGTFMYLPYLEYWREGDNLLNGKTMTATVEGTPGAEYTVKMLVRVRTYPEYTDPYPDPNNPDIDPMTIAGYPKGMTIQIGDGTPITPRWTKINNADSPYRGTNGDKLWICDLWNYAETDLPKGHVDQDGKLRIKFILDENVNNGGTSNVAWLSFKYVYVNYDGEDLTQALADLQAEVDYANANYYKHLGFDPEEYAPYTNVDELIALKRAQQVHDASENYFLVKAAYDKLYEYNHGGENGQGTWTKNPYEMNGFFWTDDYTNEDVKHVEWYDYEDDCITPSGWNLIGRNDGFSTGIVKLGVNSEGEGLKSVDGETALRAKYETDYGQEIGYTLPLKAGVKYIMTFTYAYEGDAPTGCPFETRISMSAPRTGVDNVLTEPLTVTEIQPLLPSGDENQANWYMYRATFVPEYTADYVITFDKDNVDPEPVLYGELTLVRYYEGDASDPNDENVYVINGESRNYGETLEEPKFVGKNVRITRTFNPGAYNSLVLPFKLAECELKEALGENWNGKVYYYTGATPTDTEGGDFYTLNFEERESGIFANVPVLFFSDADNPVNNWAEKIFNKMVTKRVENELTVDTDVFDFIGTYETIKLPDGAWYINAANQFKKSIGKSSLSPTRGYFLPRDANGVQITQAKLLGFSIDNVPTGIIAIEDDGTFNVTSGNIYTIDGRLVRQNATSLEGLAPGTYIVDGKKYIIK